MTLKGKDAERVCLEVLRQLDVRLPPMVKLSVSGGRISARTGPQPTQTIRPGDPGYEEQRTALGRHAPPPGPPLHTKQIGRYTGAWATFGFGTWMPFLPRGLAVKLAYIDVVETIQDVVSSASGSPWPGEDFSVRAEQEDDAIRLWFEGKDGMTRSGVTLPMLLAKQDREC